MTLFNDHIGRERRMEYIKDFRRQHIMEALIDTAWFIAIIAVAGFVTFVLYTLINATDAHGIEAMGEIVYQIKHAV